MRNTIFGALALLLQLSAMGAGAYGGAPLPALLNPNARAVFTEEFISSVGITGYFATLSSGAGAAAANNGTIDADHPGSWSFSTGTTAAGYALAYGTNGSLFKNGNALVHRLIMRTGANLSTAGERYTLRLGLSTATTGADPNDGVFLRYVDNVNSGKWVCVARNNTAETTASDSGSAVAVNTWYSIMIIVPSGWGSAAFYVNGVNVCNLASGLPASGRFVGHAAVITKSVGTTSRDMFVDLMQTQVVVAR